MRFPPVTTVPSPRLVYLKGADARLAMNDEPEFSEAELVRADALRNVDKAQRWHETNDQCAMAIQVQRMRDEGAL